MSFTTLPEILLHVKDNFDNPCALNLAGDDGWTSWSTEDFYQTVVQLSLGMHAYGIKKENVGLIAPSSPYWVMVDLAILISGNVTVPLFKRISAESMRFESKDSKLHYMFIGHSGELEMVRTHGKGVKKIIPVQFSAEGEDIIPFSELLDLGRDTAEKEPDKFLELVKKIDPDELATIIYTSGSTGIPKGVELSHHNIVSQVQASIERFPRELEDERALSSLPMAHIFERMVVYYYLASGVPVYFVDQLERIGELIRDVKPTVMTVVPRLLEKVHARFWESMYEKRWPIGALGRAALRRAENKPVDEPFRGIKDKLYNTLIYPKLREGLGGNLKQIISGAAPLPEKTGRFFINTGFPLFEGYGLTEAAPVIAANYRGHNRLGSVGPPFPEVEVRISDEGEILARGPNVMRGYHKDKKATRETIDADGFLHTGDLGSLDEDNYLTITGRKKELFKKSTGEYVAPVPIEQKLSESRYIDMAVVIADRRKFPSALIFPDMDKAAELQKKLGDTSENIEDFLKGDQFHRAVEEVVTEVNQHLHHSEEIQAFKVIPVTLSVEYGDLTPTMKLRREAVERKYSDSIENMYLEKEE